MAVGQLQPLSELTIRDYFAAHALAGGLAAEDETNAFSTKGNAAAWAYEFADAMLAERQKALQG